MRHALTTTALVLSTLCAAIAVRPAAAQDAPPDPAAEMEAAAREAYTRAAAGVALGNVLPEEPYRWSKRWMEAAIGRNPDSSAAEAQAHLERMELLQEDLDKAIAAGMATAAGRAMTRYYVAEARANVAFATSR